MQKAARSGASGADRAAVLEEPSIGLESQGGAFRRHCRKLSSDWRGA